MKLREFEISADTDNGNTQERNQDNFIAKTAYCDGVPVGLFGVADGVGGLYGGEIASQIAVDILRENWECLLDKVSGSYNESDIHEQLSSAFQKINDRIFDYAGSIHEKMATTLSVLFIAGEKYYIAHAGDTRIYMVGTNELTQLTDDHSWVAKKVLLGEMTKEEALRHPKRNLLTNGLGIKAEPHVFRLDRRLRRASTFILCSDGIYTMVSETEWLHCLRRTDISAVAENMIRIAKSREAYDNLTVVVIRIK